MTKLWYPVIDYSICTECGACIAKCSHSAYDKARAPVPVVVHPEKCIDHCHGCGNICPAGAINYVGDETGWVPPNGNAANTEGCFSCSSSEDSGKKVIIDYLYLDLKSCDRCIGTDNVLDDVMLILTPALQIAGYDVIYNKTEIKTEELAKELEFLSSPTIRVNGHDICQSVAENNCGCCSDISGTDVDCRVFEYNGENYEVPPKEMIAESILRAVFGQTENECSCGEYELPENLKEFFKGKQSKSGCSCGGNCC